MKKISESVYQIGLGPVNVFLIDDGSLTLVDTGFPGSMDRIFAAIRNGGKKPEEIKRIVLTHAHPDHSGSAAEIQKKLGIPVSAHEDDALILEQGIAGRMPRILAPGILNWILFTLFIKNGEAVVDKVRIDEKLKDGSIIDVSGGIEVIYAPGHSLGQIALLVKNESLLIAADVCANFFSPGLSTVNEDPALAIESIGKIGNFSFEKAVFGHGSPIMKNADQAMKKFYKKLINS